MKANLKDSLQKRLAGALNTANVLGPDVDDQQVSIRQSESGNHLCKGRIVSARCAIGTLQVQHQRRECGHLHAVQGRLG